MSILLADGLVVLAEVLGWYATGHLARALRKPGARTAASGSSAVSRALILVSRQLSGRSGSWTPHRVTIAGAFLEEKPTVKNGPYVASPLAE